MTLKEVHLVIDAFIKKEEDKAQQIKIALYNNAYLTSIFVGHILGGKSIPQYSDVFKEELNAPKSQQDEAVDDSILADMMRDFARNANKQRQQQ